MASKKTAKPHETPPGAVVEPRLLDYDDYRRYLRDLYRHRKSVKRTFSFRVFARLAGFASPNFLKLVMENKRNLTPESIEKIARALKLTREEAVFFKHLVLLNQAKTPIEKKSHTEGIVRSRVYRDLHPLRQAEYLYYAKWYLVPIRELVGFADFRADPRWLAARLSPRISEEEAAVAFNTLVELGMVQQDAAGKWRQTDAMLSTGDEVASSMVAQFHREMLKKAEESLLRYGPKKRQVSSVTVGLSAETFQRMKARVDEFRKELLAMSADDQGMGEVYQINMQIFPLTQDEGKVEEQS